MNKLLVTSIFLLVLIGPVFGQNIEPYSQRMAKSQMSRSGALYVWDYPDGLFAESILKVYNLYSEDEYRKYIINYANAVITSSGKINGYTLTDYTLDNVNPGKFLIELQKIYPQAKYVTAFNSLRNQLQNQPRTNNSIDGGFWHKKVYPHQMWLDGLFMGARFYAEYEKLYNNGAAYDDIVNQFVLIHSKTYDPEFGLNYHAWSAMPDDENSFWANQAGPFLGCSKEFWARGLGWYAAALVDVIETLPDTYNRRDELIGIFGQVAAGVTRWQDSVSGCWFQLLRYDEKFISTMGNANYLEASSSSMLTYALLKAIRMGILDADYYMPVAEKAYNGLLADFVSEDAAGNLSLNRICRSAGLGPASKPQRDGSVDYYLDGSDAGNIVSNDLKGVGPFIMASVEFEMAQQNETGNRQFEERNNVISVFSDNDIVTIESMNQPICEVNFFDVNGRLVENRKGDLSNRCQFKINLPVGLYLIMVNNLFSSKIVLK